MNKFSGSITFDGNVDIEPIFSFNAILSNLINGNNNIFIYGETEINSSEELVEYVSRKVGKVISKDISISTESRIELFQTNKIGGTYMMDCIHGLKFEEVIKERCHDENLVSIREAEKSTVCNGRIIKLDYLV